MIEKTSIPRGLPVYGSPLFMLEKSVKIYVNFALLLQRLITEIVVKSAHKEGPCDDFKGKSTKNPSES